MGPISATQTYLNESNQWGWNLSIGSLSALAWGDIDGDGDTDLILTKGGPLANTQFSKVYINNGTSLIENQTWQQNLTAVQYGSLSLGDIDNDGDLDLALSGCSSGAGFVDACDNGHVRTFIYLNNGTSLTESSQWQQNLTAVYRPGSLTFGDIDNDGDLDLALCGQTGTDKISKIYTNNGTSLVESSQWQSNLNGIEKCSLAFGDFDDDSDLDLIISGRDSSNNKLTKAYLNNGTSFVESNQWETNLLNVEDSSLALADFDNDGDLDLSLTGCCDHHIIYKNNGTSFVETQGAGQGLGSVFAGSQAFGDYDSDGYLDLIVNGREEETSLHLYNASSTNFTAAFYDPESHIAEVNYGSLAWIDLDDDADLDLIETGYDTQSRAYVYLSNRSLTKNNTQPNASISGFSSTYSNNVLTLSWGNGSDVETNTSGLYYNLMIGNATANHTIVSGVYGGSSNPTAGYFGNMMQRKNLSLKVDRLSASTTYYYYVQTIDTGLKAGNWSAVQSFDVPADMEKPNVTINSPVDYFNSSSYNLVFNVSVDDRNISNVSLWGNWGNGWSRKQINSSGINGTYIFSEYIPRQQTFQWYIEAWDNATNFQNSSVRTFTNDAGVGLIENSTWQGNLTGVRFSSISLGDIDSDNDEDLALIGCLTDGGDDCENGVIAKIYTNNGTSFIENSTWQQNLTGVGFGSISFADIDNDGDLDLGLLGCTNSSSLTCTNGERIAKIYLNNGTTFTESSQWQNNLTGTFNGVLTWGDIDNDGKLDLALVGQTTSSYITKIYINNGTSLIESSQWQQDLTGIYQGEIIFGDIDNDGDLDLVLTGDTSSSKITKIYINNGTSLVESSQWQQDLLGVDRSSLSLGDFDNDGDLDLNLIGQIAGDHQYIYVNNGTSFVENQSKLDNLIGLFRGSIAFGDYDNDGDLDLAAMGKEDGYARIYENNNTYFIQDTIAHSNISDNIEQCSLIWRDVDKDNDLDLVVSGTDFQGSPPIISKIYINNNTVSNTQPNASISGFSSTYSNNVLTLSWGNGLDVETNTSGLYYNLMVGNETANHTIVSGVYGGSSNPTAGYFGNMMQRKNITLNVVLEVNETYNWYVQTIDTGLQKSNWSVIQSFNTSLDTTKPSITIENPSPSSGDHTNNPIIIFNATVSDSNLTNVTLYANWTGSMIANETNNSGLNTTYVFTKNLTSYNDGQYSWYILANDSSNNSQTSGTRSFYLDTAYPIVRLVSPANTASWTSSSTVTFSYNVTDLDIANCSLIIDGSVDQTETSVSEDTTQTFTKTLVNGNYNWYVNCTDYVGYTNNSASRSLTVSYTAGGVGGGGGGGGGGGDTPSISEFDIDFSTEDTGSFEAEQGDVKTFSFNSEIKHSIIILTLTIDSATLLILSDPITIQIKTGESKQIDINKDGINDLEVKLLYVTDRKASFVLKKLAGADIVGREELEEMVQKEALFDVKVTILDKFKKVLAGEEVSAQIEVFNINNIGQVDVVVDYYLSDKDSGVLSEGSDTLAVEAVASFVRSLTVPEDTGAGTYYFNANVTYKDFVTSSKAEFKVKREWLLFSENKLTIIIISIIILIIVVLFFYIKTIRKRETKLEKELKSLERKYRTNSPWKKLKRKIQGKKWQ